MRCIAKIFQGLGILACMFGNTFVQAQDTQKAPDWLLDNQHGETLSFYIDSAGRASLLFFWTPACNQACNREINLLYQQATQHNIKMYLLVGARHWRDDSADQNQLPSTLDQFNNARSVSRYYGVTEQPKIVLVDQRKEIVYRRLLQPNNDYTDLDAFWQRLNKPEPPAQE